MSADGWQNDLASQMVVLDDGREAGTLSEFVERTCRDNWVELMRQIGVRDIAEDEERSGTIAIAAPPEA